jgi:ERCC4-type nuclease
MIDSREPRWVQSLDFGGVPTAVVALDAGDFLVATTDDRLLAIERKTPGDFLNTLRDDRLFPQVAKLRDQSEWAYLLISGQLGRAVDGTVSTPTRDTGWEWTAIQGALLTVQELGCHVVFCDGDDDLEPAIVRLAKRRRDEKRILPPREPALLGPGEAAIAALPGIGNTRMMDVLQAAGTPADALVMLTLKHGEHVHGIGPATKTRIRNALGLEGDWALGIVEEGAHAYSENAIRDAFRRWHGDAEKATEASEYLFRLMEDITL